jgi:hypothetical protein
MGDLNETAGRELRGVISYPIQKIRSDKCGGGKFLKQIPIRHDGHPQKNVPPPSNK